tara:strand:- start:2750 stop:3286 length:537 start_codon:yes stop_codon:yes gene_type:complete
MIISSVHSNYSKKKRGFTLVEVMIAAGIITIGLGSAFYAIQLLGKGSQSVVTYSEMNQQTRKLLSYLGRDTRNAYDITIANEHMLQLMDEDDFPITYEFDSDTEELTRTSDGEEITLLADVQYCRFRYFTFRLDETSRPVEVKHIQLQASIERPILSLTTSDDIVTARFMMRNHAVSN